MNTKDTLAKSKQKRYSSTLRTLNNKILPLRVSMIGGRQAGSPISEDPSRDARAHARRAAVLMTDGHRKSQSSIRISHPACKV
jgi:hypothetical protein